MSEREDDKKAEKGKQNAHSTSTSYQMRFSRT